MNESDHVNTGHRTRKLATDLYPQIVALLESRVTVDALSEDKDFLLLLERTPVQFHNSALRAYVLSEMLALYAVRSGLSSPGRTVESIYAMEKLRHLVGLGGDE